MYGYTDGCDFTWMLLSLSVVNTTLIRWWSKRRNWELTGRHIRSLRVVKLPNASKSINLVYGLTDKLFLGSLIFSAVILVLVLFLWTNSRRREIGVRLALGMTNKTIIAQMLCEVGMVRIASFIAAILADGPVSEWVGKLILGQVNNSLGTQLANEAKSANLGGEQPWTASTRH